MRRLVFTALRDRHVLSDRLLHQHRLKNAMASRNPRNWRALTSALALSAVFVACGSDDDSSDKTKDAGKEASAGSGGSTGGSKGDSSAGTGGVGGGTGGALTGGTGGGGTGGGTAGSGTGGSATGGGGTGGGATGGTGAGGSTFDGGQPIGALCVNDTNCSQSSGKTVCCATTGCVAPCECQLETACPGGSSFLPCQTGADCNQFGGGKVCCEESTGGTTMRFCTKPNGCTGKIIP
jgi:hypothetical protein